MAFAIINIHSNVGKPIFNAAQPSQIPTKQNCLKCLRQHGSPWNGLHSIRLSNWNAHPGEVQPADEYCIDIPTCVGVSLPDSPGGGLGGVTTCGRVGVE